uniref:FBA_2 domain-containing protein n=1 Tax=Caenorhabditis tropicalis TaxID=1561998 RepID=A0A1I7T3M8_9PELO
MAIWKSIVSLFHRESTEDYFPLNRLPDIPRIMIIRLIDVPEQVKLALSSKKMEGYMKIAKIQKFEYTEISIGTEDFTIQVNDKFQIFDYKEQGNRREMEPWLNKDSSMLENAVSVLKRFQSTFPCKETGVVIRVKEPTEIKYILDALDYFIFVSLKNVELEAKTVDLVMETFKKGREIKIDGPVMPLDYSHPNAFQFDIVIYKDARWVRLEHLLSMKDIFGVELGKNNFKSEDLNALLKYWTTNDERMTCALQIDITNETDIQKEVVLDGLTVLITCRLGHFIRFLANHRKQFLLNVSWDSESFTVYTFPLAEYSTPGKNKISFAREYRVLEILQKKKDLEDNLENGEDRDGMEDKIRGVEEELARNGVYYVEGTPHIDYE